MKRMVAMLFVILCCFFAAGLQAQPSSTNAIAKRCECVSKNGPDLVQIGFAYPPYTEKWRTKLDSWSQSDAAWSECFERARNAPACKDRSNLRVSRRCECVDNLGPDLMQIGYDSDNGDQIWRVKIGGWDQNESSRCDACFFSLS
jgi:hypothetical protein